MADRTIRTVLTLDPSQYESGMQRAAKASQGLGDANRKTADQSRSAMQRMAQSARDNRAEWQQVGGTLAGVGAAVTGLMGVVMATGVSYNTLRQTSTAALTSITGSAEDANAQMDKLDDFASNSPFARDVFIRAQQQMLGFGIEAQKVIPYLDAIQNAVAAAGGSNHDIAELSRIFSQISASAKITATDLREFGNRGIDAATIIGSQMDMTGAQIRDAITDGSLDAGEALDALAAGMSMTFDGAAAGVKETFAGAVDRVKAAFRDISSIVAEPFVGREGGGLFSGLLNQIADFLRMLEGLPDPVLQAGGILTGIGGAAALAAGGFLLLVPRMVETWDALEKLGIALPDVRGKLGRLDLRGFARRASVAAAAIGAMTVAMRGLNSMSEASAGGIEQVRRHLMDLGEAGSDITTLFSDIEVGWLHRPLWGGSDVVRDLDDFHNQLRRMNDENLLEKLDRGVSNLFGGWDDSVQGQFEQRISVANDVLTDLVQSGNLEEAATQFRNLAMAAGGTDQDAFALLEAMPAFRDALIGVATEVGSGTADFELLRIAMGHLPPVTEEATSATQNYEGTLSNLAAVQKDAKDRFDEWVQSMGDAAASFGGIVDGYNAAAEAAESSTASMESWISEMEKQAEAVANWRENTLTASQQIRDDLPEDMQVAGQAMVNEMVLAGEDGAQALQTFVDGTPEQRRQLIEAWQGTGFDIGVGLANEMTSAPDGEIGANTFPAEQALSAFLGAVYNSEEDVVIDGNPVPAENVLSAVRHAILTTNEPVTIDGNDVPANDVLNALMTAIRNEEEDVTIDGNRVPADQVVVELMGWIRQQGASVKVDADTATAMSRLNTLDRTLNSINGKRVTATVAIQQYGQAAVATGGYMGHFPKFADGGSPRRVSGLLEGPGTTTSDSILARLSRKEFVVNAAATDYYGVGMMYALNRRMIPKETLIQQFAGGGSPRHVTQYPPAPRAVSSTGNLTVYVENPWTGEQVRAVVRAEADGRIGESKRRARIVGGS